MTNIKVTVTYDKPSTSKIDALLAEYALAKQIADETESYYTPLADAAEEAKFDAIMEQLETIKDYARAIYKIQEYNCSVWITTHISRSELGGSSYGGMGSLHVVYSHQTHDFEVKWMGNPFSKDYMREHPGCYCGDGYNILGNWDKWNVYQRLEADAISQLKRYIARQQERGQKQIDRLNNITKEI